MLFIIEKNILETSESCLNNIPSSTTAQFEILKNKILKYIQVPGQLDPLISMDQTHTRQKLIMIITQE